MSGLGSSLLVCQMRFGKVFCCFIRLYLITSHQITLVFGKILLLHIHDIHDVQAPTLLQNQGNPNPFGTSESIQYDEEGAEAKDSGANYGRLRDKLNEADVERRKIEEEAKNRERAAEMKREERLKKIAYMREMPEDTPAGTGEFHYVYCEKMIRAHHDPVESRPPINDFESIADIFVPCC